MPKSNNLDVAALLLRVELLLVAKNISKEEFYAGAHISSASYSQWNTGKYGPSSSAIHRMASFLGVSAAYLLGVEDGTEQKEKPNAEDIELSDEESRLFTSLRALPADLKGLGMSLCFAVIAELLRHQTAESKIEASSLLGKGR